MEELLDNMGVQDPKGFIYMINENVGSITESYREKLIEKHPLYYPGSCKEINLEDRNYPIFKAGYKYNEELIDIYHIILDLFIYKKEEGLKG